MQLQKRLRNIMHELEALVILNNLDSIGTKTVQRLISHFGSASDLLKSSEIELSSLGFLKSPQIKSLLDWSRCLSAKKDLELINKQQIQLISYIDSPYPPCLLQLEDPPPLLYIKGTFIPEDLQSVAIVGTRNCSLYGSEQSEYFGSQLAKAGITIISGLARGIDTAAHRGAVQTGRTIAIIGSGLADLYPKENELLASKIEQNGAVISELPMHTPPSRFQFPRRNRIVSALSKGTLLIEAPAKSGAMITMEIGKSLGKKLFALPGRLDFDSFKGNHLLLKSGRATLVDTPHDIASALNINYLETKNSAIPTMNPRLTIEEKNLLEIMPRYEISIEELFNRSNLRTAQLNCALMGLVLKKLVKEFPGKIYKKVMGP